MGFEDFKTKFIQSGLSPTTFIQSNQELVAELDTKYLVAIKSPYGDMLGIEPLYYAQL